MSIQRNAEEYQAPSSVATDAQVMKKSLSMKQFRDERAQRECIAKNISIPLAQVIGNVVKVEMRKGTLPDGTPNESLVGIGEFEATSYSTGEVFTTSHMYLPRYFLEGCQASLASSDSVAFAVEIVVSPTGRTIPYTYEIKNLIPRATTNPLEKMKRALQAAGRLRLPKPQETIDGTD